MNLKRILNKLTWGGFKVSTNYAFDYVFLHKFRDFSDGLTVFKPLINIDWYKGDHSPKIEIGLWLFNFTIFEFNLYNVNHFEDEI